MTREQFIAESTVPCDNRDPERSEAIFRRVRERMRRLDDEHRFGILFPVSVKAQWDAPSCSAAQLLRELSPACPLSCEDAVRALLPSWDVSLEELPFYLAARFGPIRVREAVDRVEVLVESESDKQSLKSVRYWLDVYERTFPENPS